MAKIHKTKPHSMGAEGENAQQKIERLEMDVSILKNSYYQLRKSAADLQQSETSYRLLAENQADVIWAAEVKNMSNLLDQIRKGHLNTESLESKIHPRLTYVNSAIYDSRGFTPEEFLKMDMKNTMVPSSYKKFIRAVAENLFHLGKIKSSSSHACSKAIELEVTRKDGTTFWVEVNLKCNHDIQGKPIGIVGVNREITERKKAEEILKESEEKFRAIFEGGADGILIADIKTKRFIMTNSTMCRFLGYRKDELLNLSVSDIHPKDLLPWVSDQFMKVAKGIVKVVQDIPCRRKDGSVVYADVAGALLVMNGIQYNVGFFRDSTVRKKGEEALAKAEQKYRAVFESSSDAIMMLDKKGFFDCNKATLKMFGIKTVEEFRKFHPAQLSPPK
jgi:PAS domain S-box-containing protein